MQKTLRWEGLIQRYQSYLPVSAETPIVTLYEGNTPLIRGTKLAKAVGLDLDIYLKVEGQNPTGSFKDRGMTLAVSKALENGSQAIICASTGNTSASAAAYAAKAGIPCYVLLPKNAVAKGKLAQAVQYGAKIIAIDGNFDDALEIVRKISEKHNISLVNSVNPFRLEGQKTAAFELCEQLGNAPDYLTIPVGNAGNISAYWQGFKEGLGGFCNRLPTMFGFQAAGAAPIVIGEVVKDPETIATAIRIGNPASWQKAVNARDESQGRIDSVTDEEILQAYHLLASTEGIFAEPASCAAIAGLIKLKSQNALASGKTIVCVLTGNGLKDPDTAVRTGARIANLPTDLTQIEQAILG